MGYSNESANTLPKTGHGSLHLEWRRCGKPNCRCAGGALHGPYYIRRWREGGKQRKAMVKPEDVPRVLAAMEERRRSAAEFSRMVAAVQALGRSFEMV